jgi:hypothetical protein
MALINPSNEFLVVKHSHLNNLNAGFDLGKIVDDALKLEAHTNGRRVVVAIEGDIIQLAHGEPIFTHQSFFRPSLEQFGELRKAGIAVSLEEAFDAYQTFMEQYNGRLVLCLEPKPITTSATIHHAITELKRRGIRDAYFDSFFARCLTDVRKANLCQQTTYPLSKHAIGNVWIAPILVDTELEPPEDIITVPYPSSFGFLRVPVIYGAVGDANKLARVADTPHCYGAYVRFKEGHGRIAGVLRLLYVSSTNNPQSRKA